MAASGLLMGLPSNYRYQQPDRCRGLAYASSARSALVAATITVRAAVVSSQPRVLRPQSGLTQSRSAGICLAALRSKPSIQRWLGTLGEWMS